MDYKRFILNSLLDKYEDSKHYYEEASNRRVIMNFNINQFPLYDIEDADKKDIIHYAVNELESHGIISIKWLESEVNNIIDKIFLNLEKLNLAYELTGRKMKKDLISEVLSQMKALRESTTKEWLNEFLDDMIIEIIESRKIPRYLFKEEEKLSQFIKVLKGIEQKKEDEILERIFSKKYLGNSKYFEKLYRGKLILILKKYLNLGDDMSDDDILEQVGIIKTAEDMLFYGKLEVELNNKMIDFSSFVYGASMNTDTIRNFKIISFNGKRIITIENKATYIEYIKRALPEEFVIYLAGFYSPRKKLFLQKLYNYIMLKENQVEFYHWGDIDAGGFSIFMQLKNHVIPEIIPLHMDILTLQNNFKYCENIDKNQRLRLNLLQKNNQYKCFHSTIKYMIENNVRLEQEALL